MTTVLQLLRLGYFLLYFALCTGVMEELIWNSITCQSPQLQVGVLSLSPLESFELTESWEESEALAKVRKVWCLFFNSSLVLVFKLG